LFDKAISKAITQKISDKPYTKSGLSIAVYDSPGLERDKKQSDKVKQDVSKFIKQQNRKEPSEQIHAVWYYVNSQVNRETEIDSHWIGSIAKELPVLAVITRAYSSEEKLLQILESTPGIKRVVPVIAERENFLHGQTIEAYGLDHLLTATEDLLEDIAQKAIANAVKTKADKAFAWYRDGCATVLASRLVPVPGVKLATPLLQTFMLGGMANSFGYQFSGNYLSKLVKAATVASSLEGIDTGIDRFLENKLTHLPGIDYDNIQTVKDVMSHLTTSLDHVTGVLPFKDQLLEILSNLSNSHWVSALPILNCVTAIATTLSTGLLAIAFIETLKKCKQAEYEGKPKPDLEEIFAEEVKQIMELIRQFAEPSRLPGFSS